MDVPLGSQPKKELTSASFFIILLMATYQQWSQSYFTNLTPDQHNANNRWFKSIRDKLTDSGVLYVPILDKNFNKSGEEVNTHKLQPISYYNPSVDVNNIVKERNYDNE